MTVEILKFSMNSCVPCKQLSAIMQNVKTDISIKEVDVDEQQELAAQYGIRGVPTLIMLEEGKEVKRHVGMMTTRKFEEFIA